MESIAIAVEYYQNGIYISMNVYNATLAIVSLFLIMARWSHVIRDQRSETRDQRPVKKPY